MSNKLQLAGLVALALLSVVSVAQAGGLEGPPPAAPSSPCVPGHVRPDLAGMRAELTAARARWQAAGVRDYSYDFRQIASPVLFPTVRVTVRGGAVRGVALVAGQTGQPSAQARATVEGRFMGIAGALNYQRTQSCPLLEVTYDPQDGHPTRLYSGTGERNVADGDGEWTLTNFTRP
jgi:hypothetical protein